MITGTVIHKREDFAEFLTHDCYIIQLPHLENEKRNKLERALQVFNQEYKLKDEHFMFFETDDSDTLVNKMADRLARAATNEEMRYQMDFEDEYNRVIQRNLDEKNKIISIQILELEAKDKAIEAKDKAIEAKDKAIEAERIKNDELLRKVAELEQENKKENLQ